MADPDKSISTAGTQTDEALFKSLEKKKKKKKRRIIRTVIIIIILILVGGYFGVKMLRKKVDQSLLEDDSDVTSYAAKRGSISTTVSGYGTLTNVDEEQIEIPAGVKVVEVTVDADAQVKKGDVLATIEPASVLEAMNTLQTSIEEIDKKLQDAEDGDDAKYVQALVSGRVKKIYAEIGDNVTDCMYDHGALALLSLDGYMACDLEMGSLSAGDKVQIIFREGKTEQGTVERVSGTKATVIFSDATVNYGESVEILSQSGEKLGAGAAYIHSPLRVTAVAGTVDSFNVKENDSVYSGSCILALKNTEYAANYDYLLKQRNDLEEDLLTLNELYRDGSLLAPYGGTVVSVDYDENASKTTTTVTYFDNRSTASTVDKSKDPIAILTLSPDNQVSAKLSIDEANILSLEIGQSADVTINSIGEDVFSATLTGINKTGTSNSGVTKYSATVTMDKTPKMLAGMTASVTIRIEGVDDAIIIPVDALHQTSSTSFVYTSYNEETHEYGNPVEVETGVSNSSYVEIVSGLEEGTTVYYVESQQNPFGFGGFGGGMSGGFGGGMPSGGFSGGGMPSGGFGGGGGGRSGGGNFGGGRP